MNAEERQLRDLPELKIFIIGDVEYLGIKEGDNIEYALSCGEKVESDHFCRWFQKWNVEELQTIEISKQMPFMTRKLDEDEKVIFEVHRQTLAKAKRYALNYWENEVYTRLISKIKEE